MHWGIHSRKPSAVSKYQDVNGKLTKAGRAYRNYTTFGYDVFNSRIKYANANTRSDKRLAKQEFKTLYRQHKQEIRDRRKEGKRISKEVGPVSKMTRNELGQIVNRKGMVISKPVHDIAWSRQAMENVPRKYRSSLRSKNVLNTSHVVTGDGYVRSISFKGVKPKSKRDRELLNEYIRQTSGGRR